MITKEQYDEACARVESDKRIIERYKQERMDNIQQTLADAINSLGFFEREIKVLIVEVHNTLDAYGRPIPNGEMEMRIKVEYTQ